MKKTLIKNIIKKGLVFIFSLSLIVPIGLSFAQNNENNLKLTAEKTTIKKGDSVKIRADLLTKSGGEYIYYTIKKEGVTEGVLAGGQQMLGCTVPKIGNIDSVDVESDSTIKIEPDPVEQSCRFTVTFSEKGKYTLDGYSSPDSSGSSGFTQSKNSITITVEDSGGVILPGSDDKKDPNQDNSENNKKDTDTNYYPLEGLPGLEKGQPINTAEVCAFGKYLNIIFRLVIGISAVLAVVMIIYGGIEYISGGAVSEKENGKETITNAILGLVIALGAWLLLNTLNPQLLNVCLDLTDVKIKINAATVEQETYIGNRENPVNCTTITDVNNPCNPKNLENYFKEKSTSNPPFDTIASQASAICKLESGGNASLLSKIDICSDNKPFSFGLFQINGSAHRDSIEKCKNAFEIPSGHGNSQGNPIEKVKTKNGSVYNSKWSCITKEPAYTECKNYLTNPINNITEAYKIYQNQKSAQKWKDWQYSYNSCKSKF